MNRFGAWMVIRSWKKKKALNQGTGIAAFICPACGFRRQSVEHRERKGLCSKELQLKHFSEGGK